MRTTVDIDEDILEAARSLARSQGRSLGEVLSQLARQGLAPRPQDKARRGFPVFEVSEKGAVITPEMVAAANEDS